MKKIFRSLALLYLFFGVATAADLPKPESHAAHTLYRSADVFLPLAFQYPSHWKLIENKGKMEKYFQILLLGPRNAEGTYNATIVVRGAPTKKSGGRYGSLNELMENYKAHLYKDPVVQNEAEAFVAGIPGKEINATYRIPALHLKGLKGKSVPVQSKMIFFYKGDLLCEIGLTADEREFAASEAAFQALVESIRF